MRDLAAGILLAFAAACATGGAPGDSEPRETASVEVINEIQPPTSVSVYLAGEVGGRSLLGSVDPMSRETLRIRSLRPGASYRLEARTGGGRSIESGLFTLGTGETVTWDLGANVIAP